MLFCFCIFYNIILMFIEYAFKQVLLLFSNRKPKLQTEIKKKTAFAIYRLSVVAVIVVINIIDFIFA